MAFFRAQTLDDPAVSPTEAVEIDWTHPLSAALSGVWLFNTHIGLVANLINGRVVTTPNYSPDAYPSVASLKSGPGGISWTINSSSNTNIALGPASEIYAANSTFGLVARDVAGGGSSYHTLSDGTFDAYLPFTDGNAYWDYPGTGNRVSAPLTASSGMSAMTLAGGSAGRSIIRNGSIVYADATTTATATPGSANFYIGNSAGAPMFEYYSFFAWKRQLTIAEQIAWSRAPYEMLRPLRRKQYFASSSFNGSVNSSPASGQATVTGLTPTVSAGVSITPSYGSASAVGYPPGVSASFLGGVTGPGLVSANGLAGGVSAGGVISVSSTPGTGHIVCSGLTPIVLTVNASGVGASGNAIGLLFNIGPRISAQVLGTAYGQYRTSGASNPTASNNQISTIPVWITADAKGMGNKAFAHGKPVAYAMLDQALAAVGDYLIGQFGTFFIASMDGVMPTQVVRCNQTITVSRPNPTAPGSTYYGGAASGTLAPLLTSWPAAVIQGTKGERGEVNLPGDTRLSWVSIMLPATAGVEILPGDWVTTAQATPMTYTVSSCEVTPLGWRLSAATAVA